MPGAPSPPVPLGAAGGPLPSGPLDPGPSPRGVARIIEFLRRHPVLALLLLTPGIPEYLSTSSSLTGILISPPVFLLFLGFNVGLYGPGVLLIREARIRWNKGWATVILLGAAYAITEEGIALSTFFNPHASVVGALGFYGHFAGVSWVWVAGLLMVHIVFSISLPLLIFGLALPEWNRRSLLTLPQVRAVTAILVVDVSILFLLVLFGERFWMGWPALLGSLGTIAALVAAARWAPADLLSPRTGPPSASPWKLGALGLALFPGTLLIEGFGEAAHSPPVLVIAGLGAFFAGLLYLGRRALGDRGNRAHQVAFAAGVVVFIAFFGFIAALPLPVVVVADGAFGYLFLRLWRTYSRGPSHSKIPDGALPS
jgi:hypothetical protein